MNGRKRKFDKMYAHICIFNEIMIMCVRACVCVCMCGWPTKKENHNRTCRWMNYIQQHFKRSVFQQQYFMNVFSPNLYVILCVVVLLLVYAYLCMMQKHFLVACENIGCGEKLNINTWILHQQMCIDVCTSRNQLL